MKIPIKFLFLSLYCSQIKLTNLTYQLPNNTYTASYEKNMRKVIVGIEMKLVIISRLRGPLCTISPKTKLARYHPQIKVLKLYPK